MRAIWTGSISFGLINIPVRLYSASEEHPITFDLLHRTDLSPIRYARICKEEEKEVPYKDIVKGYEYQQGQYVVVDEEELKGADEEKTKTIEIKQFAHLAEIECVFFERPYYLEPGKGADKAYALLRETLKMSQKAAIVKFVIKNKEHLGVLKEYHNVIVLDQMRFAEEMRNTDDLKVPSSNLITKKEMDMSLKLVEQLTETFNPEQYRDEYTEKLKETIKAKVKSQEKPSKKKMPVKKSSKIHDITALLEASLKAHKPAKHEPIKRKNARK
jgi:DNA end-binding protein Ku